MNSHDMRQADSIRELAQLEYLLLGDLHQILSEPVSSHTRPNLVAVLDLLFTMLPSRFDLEESSGHLAAVLDQFPNWHDQVEMLRIEHALLYEELRDLRQALDGEAPYEPVSEEVIHRIRTWMDRLRNHEREERRLTLLANPPIAAAE